VYSKMGGRGEPRNSKNLPLWTAEFGKRHGRIWQNLPRKTVGPSEKPPPAYGLLQVCKCTGRQQSRKRVYVSDEDYEPDEDERYYSWVACVI